MWRGTGWARAHGSDPATFASDPICWVGRTTLSYEDCVTDPQDVGTADHPLPVVAALLETLRQQGYLLGRSGGDVGQWWAEFQSGNGWGCTGCLLYTATI